MQLERPHVPFELLDGLLDLAVGLRVVTFGIRQNHFTVDRLLHSLLQGPHGRLLVALHSNALVAQLLDKILALDDNLLAVLLLICRFAWARKRVCLARLMVPSHHVGMDLPCSLYIKKQKSKLIFGTSSGSTSSPGQ